MLAEAYLEDRPLPFRDGPLPLWLWPFLIWLFHRVPYLLYFDFPLAALATTRFLSYFLSRRQSAATASFLSRIVLKFLAFLGLISYSLYLLHLPLFGFFSKFTPRSYGSWAARLSHLSYVALVLVVIAGVSYLLYLVVEEPGIALGKWVIKRLRPAGPADPANSGKPESMPTAHLK